MSHYTEIQTEFIDVECLIESLCAVKNGFQIEQIEVHKNPETLYGYQGDARQEKANIIIRRQNVGTAANDVGFVRDANGTYKAIISEYDQQHRCNKTFLDNVRQEYACRVIEKQVRQKGLEVTRIPAKQAGEVLIHVRGYGR